MTDTLKILVAEDELITRKLLEKLLRSEGHWVQSFDNGADAWAYFGANPVNVVVSDWMMPDMDGLELCRKARSVKRDDYTYFVLLTAMSRSHENLHVAVDAGVDDFLSKPINPDDLWMRLRVAERIINFARQVRQLETLIPICSYCKKVRNDSNLWQAVDSYLSQQTGRDLSHSICPECLEKVLKEEVRDLQENQE